MGIKISALPAATTVGATDKIPVVQGGATKALSGVTIAAGAALSGSNTGDQTNILGNAATVTRNANLTGDVTSSGNATTIGSGKVTEAMQVLADNTTQNVSTSKHGYAPKGDGDTAKFLNANGAYSTPGGDIAGPGSSTDNAIPRFDGTTGKLLQNSPATVNDAGSLNGLTGIGQDFAAGSSQFTMTAPFAAPDGNGYGFTIEASPKDGAGTTGGTNVLIAGGGEGNSAPSRINMFGGGSGYGGFLQLKGGNAGAATDGNGGYVEVVLGNKDGAGAQATFQITKGSNTASFNVDTLAADRTFTLPDASGTLALEGGSSGDVVGPASADDNAITRFDSTTGKLVQNSSVYVTDAGNIDYLVGIHARNGTNFNIYGGPANSGGTGKNINLVASDPDGDATGSSREGGGSGIFGGNAEVGGPGVTGAFVMATGARQNSSRGGDVVAAAGMASSGSNMSGGSVYLNPGAKDGAGTAGTVIYTDPASGNEVHLSAPTLTNQREIYFPDASITLGTVEVTFTGLINAALTDQAFFLANRAYQVTAVSEVHSAASAIAANVQLTKDTATNAPGAGTDLLTNNTNAGFDINATANTVQAGTLTGTLASLQLAAGDRLSVDFSGNVTGATGVVVTVTLMPI